MAAAVFAGRVGGRARPMARSATPTAAWEVRSRLPFTMVLSCRSGGDGNVEKPGDPALSQRLLFCNLGPEAPLALPLGAPPRPGSARPAGGIAMLQRWIFKVTTSWAVERRQEAWTAATGRWRALAWWWIRGGAALLARGWCVGGLGRGGWFVGRSAQRDADHGFAGAGAGVHVAVVHAGDGADDGQAQAVALVRGPRPWPRGRSGRRCGAGRWGRWRRRGCALPRGRRRRRLAAQQDLVAGGVALMRWRSGWPARGAPDRDWPRRPRRLRNAGGCRALPARRRSIRPRAGPRRPARSRTVGGAFAAIGARQEQHVVDHGLQVFQHFQVGFQRIAQLGRVAGEDSMTWVPLIRVASGVRSSWPRRR